MRPVDCDDVLALWHCELAEGSIDNVCDRPGGHGDYLGLGEVTAMEVFVPISDSGHRDGLLQDR